MKIFRKIRNLIVVFFFNLRYYPQKCVSLGYRSDIEGTIKVKSEIGTMIRIGNVHVLGPLYLKACDRSNIKIMDGCFFNHNVSITALDSISIGKGCSFGNNVVIVDHNHSYRNPNGGFTSEKVVIGNNVWVGANVVILKGTVIEDNSIIGAGSVVKSHIPQNTIFFNSNDSKLTPYEFEK